MLPRKYSLKTRYNFNKVYKFGETFSTKNILIKFLKLDSKVLEKENVKKKFSIVASNKLTKKKVNQNKLRRLISNSLTPNLERFSNNYYYVFIPKKNCLDQNDKIMVNDKEIDSQINTFLSKIFKF